MAIKRGMPGLPGDNSPSLPTAKRPRQDTPRTSLTPGRLEQLPTEILQQIFFASLNGNLLEASLRIAAKLSGSQNIYRTAFFISFYHHKILELRHEFRFEYLLPEIEFPVPFWELRSMAKAVLDSRWCTWLWVQNLLLDRLKEATAYFRREFASKTRWGYMEELLTSVGEESLFNSLRFCLSTKHTYYGTGKYGAENELQMNLFCMAITSCPTGSRSRDYDDEGYPWEVTEHWRLEFHPFGDISFETSKLDDSYPEGTLFRDLVHRSFGICGISVRQSALGMWQRLEGRLYDAIAIGDTTKLRHLLQMDYFLRPEDLPYKIPTQLYRAAAQSDYNRLRDGDEILQLLLHVLFSIDPHSLPRGAAEIRRWAILAQNRVRSYAQDRHLARVDLKWEQREDDLTERAKKEARNDMREKDYVQKMDMEILRFLGMGELARKPNMISPSFAPPVLWLPNEAVNEKEILAEDDEEVAVVRRMTCEELQSLVGGFVMQDVWSF
jgi:hypothetical protein